MCRSNSPITATTFRSLVSANTTYRSQVTTVAEIVLNSLLIWTYFCTAVIDEPIPFSSYSNTHKVGSLHDLAIVSLRDWFRGRQTFFKQSRSGWRVALNRNIFLSLTSREWWVLGLLCWFTPYIAHLYWILKPGTHITKWFKWASS